MPCLAGVEGNAQTEDITMKDMDRATVNMLVKWVSECSKRFSGPNIDSDELAQIALEKILKTKEPPRNLSYSWVYTITANAKNDMLRSAYREKKWMDLRVSVDMIKLGQASEDLLKTAASVQSQPDPFLDAEVSKSVEKLSPLRKEAFSLYVLGYSYKEISALTRVDMNTVKTRIHYARRQLKEALSA